MATNMQNRRIVLASRPQEVATLDNFRLETVPAVIERAPVQVFTPPKVNVPEPAFVRVPEPETIPFHAEVPVARFNVPPEPVRTSDRAEVIAALADDLTLDAARGFVLARERVVSTTLEQAGSRFNPPISLNAEHYSVGSSFFLVAGMVRFERVEASTEALFFRGPARVDLLWRQQF